MDEDGNPELPLFQPVRLRPICSISRIIRQIEGISLSAMLVGLMTTDRYTYVMVSDNPLMKPGRKYMPQHDDLKTGLKKFVSMTSNQDNVMTFKEKEIFLA